jgi:hypothetical protein
MGEVRDGKATSGIELVPIGALTMKIGDIFTVGRTPFGHRGIGEIYDGRIDGARLHAEQAGRAAADWGRVSDDGLVYGDIRVTWRTADHATLLMTYQAVMDGTGPAYAAMRFEAGEGLYSWMNRVQIIGKGTFDPVAAFVHYDLYELR